MGSTKDIRVPVIRVFVSSTFRDMQSERDELIRFVFPKLNAEFRDQGVRIEAIDLRWGIVDGDPVVSLCRELIDESDIFLGLLGERYGWVPDDQPNSITADEILYGALERPQGDSSACFLFRASCASRSVPEAESRDFAEPLESEALRRLLELKQMVMAAFPSSASYSAKWNEKEARFEGLGEFSELAYQALRPLIEDHIARNSEAGDNSDRETQLHDFYAWEHSRGFITDHLREKVREIDAFVWSQFDLSEPIDSDPDEQKAIEDLAAQFERNSREAFSLARNEALANKGPGRERGLERFEHFNEKTWPLYRNRVQSIVGSMGSGRTAFLSYLSRRYAGRDDLTVISHFVGASEESADHTSVLLRFMRRVGAIIPRDTDDPWKLRDSLRVNFDTYTNWSDGSNTNGKKNLLIILDNADADSRRQSPHKLPSITFSSDKEIAGRTSVLLSQNETEYANFSSEYLRRKARERIDLVELNSQSRLAMISEYLARFGKRLREEEMVTLARKQDASSPAYLQAALSELVTFGVYEEVASFVENIPPTISALFDFILDETCKSYSLSDPQGGTISIAPMALSLLASSYGGLSYDELVDVIEKADPTMLPRRELPAFLHSIRPHLEVRGHQYAPKDTLRSAVERASSSDIRFDDLDAHGLLADHFLRQFQNGSTERRVRNEIMHHLRYAERHDEAVSFLLPLARAARDAYAPRLHEIRAEYLEYKLIISVLENLHESSWHPQKAEWKGTANARTDYVEVYKFSCCGHQVATDGLKPPQLTDGGCKANDDSRECKEAKNDAIREVLDRMLKTSHAFFG